MADDLHSLLTEAALKSDSDAAAAEKPAEREKPDAAAPAPETDRPASGERPRGPDGKFLSKETSDSAETETDEPAEAPESEETPEPEETATEAPKVEVPKHWTPADKEMVASLPAEHRAKVVETYKRIEAAFTPKLMRAAEIEKRYGGVDEIFAPYADELKRRGLALSDIIRDWHNAQRLLSDGAADAQQGRPNEKGAQIIARLIQNYRVNPGDVAAILQGQIAPAQQPTASADHVGGQLPPEAAARIAALEQRENARAAAQQAERQAAVQSRIDAFAAEKDAAGNLLHPHFVELESTIAGLARLEIDQGRTPDLADLYDQAVYANRETRQKLLSAQADEQKRKALADRKAKAVAAQKAASSITGSPGTGQSPSEQRGRARSLREELDAAAADIDAA
jgi:hypothetical protein